MKAARPRCFTDLARIKLEMTRIEKRMQDMQSKCIEEFRAIGQEPPHKVETKYGTLTFVVRENWKVADKDAIVAAMGQENFVQFASITKKGVQDWGGVNAVTQLEESGALRRSEASEYYKFSEAKERNLNPRGILENGCGVELAEA